MIDDISVMVVELGSMEPEPAELPEPPNRKTIPFHSIAVPREEEPVKVGVVRGDMIRGSFLPGDDPKAKKGRFDAKRGSYANAEGKEEEEKYDDIEKLEDIEFTK
jgi:hypothetical protein